MNAGALGLTHTKKKPYKNFNMTVAILLFYHQNTFTKLPSYVLVLFEIKPSDALLGYSSQITQNLEFINVRYVTHKQPIWVSLKRRC